MQTYPSCAAQSGEVAGILKQLKGDMEADLGKSPFESGEKMEEQREDGLAKTAERRTVLTGYMDGTMRVFSVCRDRFVFARALKPHDSMVRRLEYIPDGRFVASLGVDNAVSRFEVRGGEEHAAYRRRRGAHGIQSVHRVRREGKLHCPSSFQPQATAVPSLLSSTV